MDLLARWKDLGRRVKTQVEFYRRVAAHPRTPASSRRFLLCAVGYALLPFDLIPDWIPILGHLDDVVIVPGLIWIALRRIPSEVLDECRASNDGMVP